MRPKRLFKANHIKNRVISIKPTWETLEEVTDKDLVIEIDPGTAFGTGAHETTKLCILGLRKYITPETQLLDVGCGSGILSIIGVKLGAKYALGTDIDANALVATKENIEVNKVAKEQFDLLSGNIITDEAMQEQVGLKKYDIVVANILADVIIPLSGVIQRNMKEDGLFISSGIINTKKAEVKEEIGYLSFVNVKNNVTIKGRLLCIGFM